MRHFGLVVHAILLYVIQWRVSSVCNSQSRHQKYPRVVNGDVSGGLFNRTADHHRCPGSTVDDRMVCVFVFHLGSGAVTHCGAHRVQLLL